MEILFSVVPVCVQFQCPVCETGYLIATGKKLMSNPPKHEHVCNRRLCSSIVVLETAYPQLRNIVNSEPLEFPPDFKEQEKKAIN